MFATRVQTFFNLKGCNPLAHVHFLKDGSPSSRLNTTCFEALVHYVMATSPSKGTQFITIPSMWLGGSHDFVPSWQGLQIFQADGQTLATPFKTGFGAVMRQYLHILQQRGTPAILREIKLVDEPDWTRPLVIEQFVSLLRFVKSVCAEFGGCCVRTSGTLPIPQQIVSLLDGSDIWDVHADSYTRKRAAAGASLPAVR